MTVAQPETLEQLQSLCDDLCHLLEREHSVLRSRNGLIGAGVAELEQLHGEKDHRIDLLDRASRGGLYSDQAKADPARADTVRQSIERCKSLQARNHQVFSRVVGSQRRLLSMLRDPAEDVSLYDRGGRSLDYGGSNRAHRA